MEGLDDGVDLDAVAGGQHHRLGHQRGLQHLVDDLGLIGPRRCSVAPAPTPARCGAKPRKAIRSRLHHHVIHGSRLPAGLPNLLSPSTPWPDPPAAWAHRPPSNCAPRRPAAPQEAGQPNSGRSAIAAGDGVDIGDLSSKPSSSANCEPCRCARADRAASVTIHPRFIPRYPPAATKPEPSVIPLQSWRTDARVTRRVDPIPTSAGTTQNRPASAATDEPKRWGCAATFGRSQATARLHGRCGPVVRFGAPPVAGARHYHDRPQYQASACARPAERATHPSVTVASAWHERASDLLSDYLGLHVHRNTDGLRPAGLEQPTVARLPPAASGDARQVPRFQSHHHPPPAGPQTSPTRGHWRIKRRAKPRPWLVEPVG